MHIKYRKRTQTTDVQCKTVHNQSTYVDEAKWRNTKSNKQENKI